MITRGQAGYRPIQSTLPAVQAVALFNTPLNISAEDVDTMLAGSMFGWDCKAAQRPRSNPARN